MSELRGAECECPACGKVFPSLRTFDEHLVHGRLKPGYLESGAPWCQGRGLAKSSGSVTSENVVGNDAL